MWMCGVRPRYQPGTIDSKRTLPFESVRWMPRRKVPVLPCTPEYMPRASQCQISTAALRIGAQVVALTTLKRSVSGVPGRPPLMLRRTRSRSR